MRHLNGAYHGLCHQRRGFPATADVWHLRQHWLAERQQLQAELLAGSHGKLRRAVCTLNMTFDELKLAQAPDKTFIGRIARGFDFVGYYFSRAALALAPKTLERHATR